MPSYRFRIFDTRGRFTAGRVLPFDSDDQASSHADRLVESGHIGVEVWQSDRMVYRADRPAVPRRSMADAGR